MKAILIDDEPKSKDLFATILLQHCPDVEIVGAAASGPEGFTLIQKLRPDVVFLDVEMPGMTGIELLNQLTPMDFEVIFMSDDDRFARQAMLLGAIGYLNKPPVIEEIIASVLKAERIRNQKKWYKSFEMMFNNILRRGPHLPITRIPLPTKNNSVEYIDLHHILYIEAQRAYSTFYLNDARKITVAKNIGIYEDLLSDLNFVRTHRSYLVNLGQIRFFKKGDEQIVLFNGAILPVAKNEKEKLLNRLGGS